MKTLIVSGGRINSDFALSYCRNERFDQIIGVDRGLEFLYENNILPTYVVGDFDSADPKLESYYRKQKEIEVRWFNPVKDSTDTQIAIELALELNSASIVILGGTGSRLDHVLGNIQSMMLARDAGVDCILLDEYNRIRLISEDTIIKKNQQYGRFVSLIPLTSTVEGVDLIGFKYPLHNHTFTSTGSAGLGVSNEVMEEEAVIHMKSGILVLIESLD
ncbi:thiamine diphosphokinase [Candidatus Merdisoma sp. JLR.KK006]|uniref:thiamine diphosphokinase n=1 Tax=Candidatus Merdisoma sp. JLR.KK006 TaxID=3112626 RepID=UPI002FEE8D23